MELYNNELTKHKITGTYIIKGDTTIILSYKNENGYSQVLIYGNNKTMNFVDGFWETGVHTKGSFYLQKKGKALLIEQFILPLRKKS